jgi:integrase
VNRRIGRPALLHAGLAEPGYRFHDLRHTCVSRLVAAGADVKLVQAVAGHASPLITLKRYSHLLDSRITEAASRFDPARAP